MPIHFDLADLQAFVAVSETGNFRKAAELVHISQPAFSRRIEKLEQALGVRLLDRNTRRVDLTAVGREFARKARGLLDELDATLLGIQEVAATRMGEVTVACVPSAAFYFLPQVIQRYHAAYPNIRVKILDASANEVLSAVARGEADFGLNFMGSAEADLEFKVIQEEPFVLACRRDHPLARRRSVAWKELKGHDFMTVARSSGNRLLLDLALVGVQDRPVCIYEAQHVLTLLGLVEAGLGVAAVPRLAMPPGEHPILVSVPLKDPVVTRRMGLIQRRGRSLSPAAQQLFKMFDELRQRRRARLSKSPPSGSTRRAPSAQSPH